MRRMIALVYDFTLRIAAGSCLVFLIATHCCHRLISGKQTGPTLTLYLTFIRHSSNLRRHSNSRPRRGKVNEPIANRLTTERFLATDSIQFDLI